MGLLIHTRAMVSGMLQPIQMLRTVAGIIWNGMGRKQQKKPTRNA